MNLTTFFDLESLDWKIKKDLNTICEVYRNPQPKPYRRKRDLYSYEDVLNAAIRYDKHTPNGLSLRRVAVVFLFFHCGLSVQEIAEQVDAPNPQGWISRFKPWLLDPNYNPSPRINVGKHPALLGLTVREAAKTLGCSEQIIYNYLANRKVLSLPYQLMFDEIFLRDNPPEQLIDAATEKDQKQIQKNYNKQNKYLTYI